MKQMTLKRAGIHWRLATVYGPIYPSEDIDDFCRYARAVLIGILAVIGVISVGGVCFSLLVGPSIGWLAASIALGQCIEADGAVILFPAVVASVTMVIVGCYYFQKARERKRERKRQLEMKEVEPTFWENWYRSFKEKACYRLKLVD